MTGGAAGKGISGSLEFDTARHPHLPPSFEAIEYRDLFICAIVKGECGGSRS